MGKPFNKPYWATETVNNGSKNTPNKVEPTELKKQLGWNFPEKPPRSEFNWWQNLVGQWIDHLDTISDTSGVNNNFAYDSAGSTLLDFSIEAGYVFLGTGDPVLIPAKVIDFTGFESTTQYVYLDLNDIGTPTTVIKHQPTSYPSSDHIPLYVVTVGASAVASFIDNRTWAIQGGTGDAAGATPESEEQTATAGQTIFTTTTLNGLVDENTWMYVNGVRLSDSEYSVSGSATVLYQGTTLLGGEDIRFTKLTTISGVLSEIETQTASASQDTFVLTQLADNKNLTVYVNGVFQADNFTKSGSDTIILDDALTAGDVVHFVKNANASTHAGVATATGNMNGTGTPAFNSSYNMDATITDNGVGNYSVTFAIDRKDTNYMVIPGGEPFATKIINKATTGFDILTYDATGTATDYSNVDFVVYGE